ncbi:MAG: DUF3106 domain-containing protein [Nitrosomonas sp.]|nr:DUF3106 domain-containing protein [Nitrosomonas sp.]MBK7364126.1 DUF3106 domain-containing protein [Nitrosomonas sp.]
MFPITAFSEQKHAWSSLKPYQKIILQPLAHEWDEMEPTLKKKWLRITKHYLKRSPQEQQRIQSQMRNWSRLTTEQKKLARDRYKKLENLPPGKLLPIIEKWRKTDERSESAQ